MRSLNLWRICCAVFFLLSAVVFTPLVIPQEVDTPYLFGMPRTLWTGISISIGFLIVILIAAWAIGSPQEGEES